MKIMEPQLKPAYVRKALSIQKQAPIKVGSVDALRKRGMSNVCILWISFPAFTRNLPYTTQQNS